MALTNEVQLKPNLRFPRFRNDSPWSLLTLGDCCDRLTETVGDTQLVPVSITAGRGFVAQEEKFGRDISGSQYSKYIRLERGDFAYNRGNSKRFPQGCVYELTEFDNAAASNAFYCFRLHDEYEPEFFAGLFENNTHGRQLARDITSGARSTGLLNISADAFFGVSIPMPSSVAEQAMIAECLGSLKELITLEERRLASLRQHRRGLLQELFPRPGEAVPGLRFGEFRGEKPWDELRLEPPLATRGSGHTPNKSKPEYYDGGIKWVSLADSKRLDRGLLRVTEREISDEGIKNSSAVLHEAGSVILSRDAGVGKSAVLSEAMAVSQHFIVWTCNPTLLSNWFLYYQLQLLKPLFETVATGSTIKTIGLAFFRDLRILVPSLAEQSRIVMCLSSVDDLISQQSRRLDALRAHRRGLLQHLFPAVESTES